MTVITDSMTAVWAHALYTPHGRVSDFFRLASETPQPRPWDDYRTTDLEVLRVYVGDMTTYARQRFFSLATHALGYEHAQEWGKQERYRNKWLVDHMLDMIADVPSMAPAD